MERVHQASLSVGLGAECLGDGVIDGAGCEDAVDERLACLAMAGDAGVGLLLGLLAVCQGHPHCDAAGLLDAIDAVAE